MRRATAVQAELVKNGVPQNAITIQGFGDTRLLVATGPGVREPQNRRVEIIISREAAIPEQFPGAKRQNDLAKKGVNLLFY